MIKLKFLLPLLFLFFIVGCDDGNVDNSEFVTVKEDTIAENITSITLNWNSGIVHFSKSNDGAVHIEERAKEDFQEANMYELQNSNGNLTINDPHYDKPVIMLSHDLNVQLPDNNYEVISLNGTSVELNFEGFKANKLEVNTNTTVQNISGEFNEVTTTFTSDELNYNFLKMPAVIQCDGKNSVAEISLPNNSEFELTETLDASEVNTDFDTKETGENKYIVGNGGNSINVDLYQSELDFKKNE